MWEEYETLNNLSAICCSIHYHYHSRSQGSFSCLRERTLGTRLFSIVPVTSSTFSNVFHTVRFHLHKTE